MNMPAPIEYALAELGTKEVPGPEDHPRIVEYHRYTTLAANHDETAWCSAFVNAVVAWSEGVTDPGVWLAAALHGTGRANARSWLDYGYEVVPQRGAIVVLWRESLVSWKGHCGIVVEPNDGLGNVLICGGNQSNAVCVKPYRLDRVLGYRIGGPKI